MAIITGIAENLDAKPKIRNIEQKNSANTTRARDTSGPNPIGVGKSYRPFTKKPCKLTCAVGKKENPQSDTQYQHGK
jgi:hypothetical protein